MRTNIKHLVTFEYMLYAHICERLKEKSQWADRLSWAGDSPGLEPKAWAQQACQSPSSLND